MKQNGNVIKKSSMWLIFTMSLLRTVKIHVVFIIIIFLIK